MHVYLWAGKLGPVGWILHSLKVENGVYFWKGCEQIKAMWQRPYMARKGQSFFLSPQQIDSLF